MHPPVSGLGSQCISGNGEDYRGTIAITESGNTCQHWNTQFPHKHGWIPGRYPCKYAEPPHFRKYPRTWFSLSDPDKKTGGSFFGTCGLWNGSCKISWACKTLSIITAEGSWVQRAACTMWHTALPCSCSRGSGALMACVSKSAITALSLSQKKSRKCKHHRNSSYDIII